MSRIIHFEVSVDNAERAISFYEKALGWKIQKWDGSLDYWFAITGEEGPGVNGAFFVREEPGTPPITNTIGVESVDESVKRVEAAGGKITTPKMTIPGIGYVAYFQDTEGNIVGMYQDDSNVSE